MPEEPDLNSRVQEILSSQLKPEEAALINLFAPVASYTTESGSTRWNHLLIDSTTCIQDTFLDVSGVSSTGADGKRTFRVSAMLCKGDKRRYGVPTNVVATPNSRRPFFVTVEHVLVNGGDDVEITVFAWDPNGDPAPNVAFDWRCRTVVVNIIL